LFDLIDPKYYSTVTDLATWMLRIDDVIHYQKEILKELKTLNSNKE